MARHSIKLKATLVFVLAFAQAGAETVSARYGKGFIETVKGCRVLHLKGTPYEMGVQHGVLLREHVRENIRHLIDEMGKEKKLDIMGFQLTPPKMINMIIGIQKKHVPANYFEELKGLAKGAGVSLEQVQQANFIPELFHCSGFAIMDDATADGTLYHGRVLDYATDWRLQEHAVLMVAEPDGKIPFLNVSFAGFIGSVTGLNMEKISIGEMGGRGFGLWDGVPMAILVRMVLENAKTLDEAVDVFKNNPRTCEYYYVVADGKVNRAVAMEASAKRFELIKPGEKSQRLPHPIEGAVLMSAGKRYEELVRRVRTNYGKLKAENALRLMDCGVAMKANLHNVLFETKSTRFWYSLASKDGQPAATQKYSSFQLSELLKRRPPEDAVKLRLAVKGL